ncbi:hypothetical protein [Mucilaginibacter sp.]|jgi:hypothetical protein|uniref:hypothetical protein n=1 Tax=Mucilaginibacter sp. TaxID=1882438 RepID=UPI003563347D
MEISINGEKYGLLWGLAAIDRFCNLVELDLESALNLVFAGDGKSQISQTIALSKFITCAIDSYAKVNKTVGGINHEQILMEFDNQGITLVEGVLDDFLHSKILGQNVSDYLGITVTKVDDTKPATKKNKLL